MSRPVSTPADCRGPQPCCQFICPAGIGDFSWIYSKICHIRPQFGKEVIIQMPSEQPQRGADFVEILRYVKWGGYRNDKNSWEVLIQSLPSEWPPQMGWGPLCQLVPIHLAANIHLEMGRPLAEWLPGLPTNYHYPLALTVDTINQAEKIISELPRPIFAVYVSNRDKDNIKAGGWSLWGQEEWVGFLRSVIALPECRAGSFVLLGAEWDRDKTEILANNLRGLGNRVATLIAQPLGLALRCLERSNYFFGYPSGIGILANVLRTPGVMLLPWLLNKLEKTYADPHDMALNFYKAWPAAKPNDVFDWFSNIGMPQVLAAYGGGWRNK